MVRRRGGPRVRIERLRAPGDGDARDRIEAVYAAVDALGADDLNLAPIPVFDMADRDVRLDRLDALAAAHGRLELLDTARDRLKDALLRRWTSRLTLAYGMESIQTGRVEDRAAIVTALRDLVAVAVMRDVLDADDAEVLSRQGLRIVGAADFDELDEMTAADEAGEADDDAGLDADDDGGPDGDDLMGDGGDVATGASADAADRDAVRERLVHADDRPGAPKPEDWAAAATGDQALRPRGFRADPVALLFGSLAVVGLLAVLGMRVERDNVVSGLVLAGALIAGIFVVFRLWSRRS